MTSADAIADFTNGQVPKYGAECSYTVELDAETVEVSCIVSGSEIEVQTVTGCMGAEHLTGAAVAELARLVARVIEQQNEADRDAMREAA